MIYGHMLPVSKCGKSSLNDENMKGAMSPRRQQWLTPHPHRPNIQPQTDIHWDWARDWPLSYLTAANSSRRSVSRQAKHSLGPIELQDHLQKCQFAAKYFLSKRMGNKREGRRKKKEVVSSRGNRNSAPTERSKAMWLNGKSNYWAAISTPSLSTDQEKMMIITMLRISRAPAVLKLWLPINQQTCGGGGGVCCYPWLPHRLFEHTRRHGFGSGQ